jgi:hypothetical protein
MEHRSVALGAGVRAGLLLAFVTIAVLPPVRAEDDPLHAKHERAARLDREAKALRAEAAKSFKTEEAECRTRFLVNDCIRAAKERRLGRIEEARRKEAEQTTLERELRLAELAARREAKIRQRAAEGPPAAVVTLPDRAPPEAKPIQ